MIAQEDSTAVKISLLANNLSEDLSIVSSKTDEVMLIVYQPVKDEATLSEPVYIEKFLFNEAKREEEDEWNVSNKQKFLFFLLEMDTENTIFQVDPVLRVYYQEVISCHKKRDYLGIEKYLGDDDVLGYGYFDIPSSHSIKGVYKLDKFDYTVTFQEQIN